MGEIAQVLPFASDVMWVGWAVLIRIGAIMAVLPAFGDQPVPARVRLILAFMFTLIVSPAVAPSLPSMPQNLVEITVLLGPEAITGLFLGLVLRFFVLALQIAGSIAAQSTSLSQIFGGTAVVDPLPAIGHVLVVGGTALAALLGLHVQVAAYIIHSYTMFPFGFAISAEIVAELGTAEVARAFGLGFTLSAPFLIASLVYNVVLGVINRAMPQLMVSFVGAPALTAGGLFLFFLTAPLMLATWVQVFTVFMDTPFGVWP